MREFKQVTACVEG